MSDEVMCKVRFRAAGFQDFEAELPKTATVLEAKIAATAGCDIDPQAMRVICRGRVLKDEETLEACGVRSGEALHIARGSQPSAASASGPAPATAAQAAQAAVPGAAGGFAVRLKGPGGVDEELAVAGGEEQVARVRQLAAERCGLKAEQAHLVHKAKMLKDGGTLSQSGVARGDMLRVARRQAPAEPVAAAAREGAGAASGAGAALEGAAGAPMPMAWGSGLGLPAGVEEQARLAARAMGVPLEELLEGMPLEQVAAAARAAAAQGGAGGQRRPPGGENATELQARFDREAREMAHQVRAYLARERRLQAAARRPGAGAPPVEAEEEEDGAEAQLDEDDAELLADVAGVLAEARSRGAPVPNAATFVDRAVSRRREARALQARLDREASGMQPELEDALAAAEVSVAAAARWPRRLGHGPGPGPGA